MKKVEGKNISLGIGGLLLFSDQDTAIGGVRFQEPSFKGNAIEKPLPIEKWAVVDSVDKEPMQVLWDNGLSRGKLEYLVHDENTPEGKEERENLLKIFSFLGEELQSPVYNAGANDILKEIGVVFASEERKSETANLLCIDDEGAYYLTKGKVYRLMNKSAMFVEIVDDDGLTRNYKSTRFTPTSEPVSEIKAKDMIAREYVLPDFVDEIESFLKCGTEWDKFRSVNLLFTGPKGTGKTELVGELRKRCGFSTVNHQINGGADVDPHAFFGGVALKSQNGVSITQFEPGPLYRAVVEGTKVDEDGIQVLDKDGNPIIVGKPGLLLFDEFAAMRPDSLLQVFNRVLEVPRDPGIPRVIEILDGNGKVIKSHPGFAMILAGNNAGNGADAEEHAEYTAQSSVMDGSSMDRITFCFEFGYNLEAEKDILNRYIVDEKIQEKAAALITKLRQLWTEGKVETLISTRRIINVAESFERLEQTYKDEDKNDLFTRALKRALFPFLKEAEKHAYAEPVRMFFAVDIATEAVNEKGYFFPRRK